MKNDIFRFWELHTEVEQNGLHVPILTFSGQGHTAKFDRCPFLSSYNFLTFYRVINLKKLR